jgi:ETC complex I subunit conserved region
VVSGDYMQATKMTFNTKEDAIAFAEKQGISLVLCAEGLL